jgi:hypothetical protein
VFSFTHRPLYSRGKITRYTFDVRLGGPQNRSGRCGKKYLYRESNPSRPARSSQGNVSPLNCASPHIVVRLVCRMGRRADRFDPNQVPLASVSSEDLNDSHYAEGYTEERTKERMKLLVQFHCRCLVRR